MSHAPTYHGLRGPRHPDGEQRLVHVQAHRQAVDVGACGFGQVLTGV